MRASAGGNPRGVTRHKRRGAGAHESKRATRPRLARGAKEDCSDILALIVSTDWQMLVATARRVVRDHDAAEDCVQTALLSVLRSKSTKAFAEDELRRYLVRAVTNAALSVNRAARTREDGCLDALRAPGPSPYEDVVVSDLRRAFNSAIAGLGSRQKQAFILVRFSGRAHAEVARMMNVSPQTVANYVSQALAAIRTALAPHLGEP